MGLVQDQLTLATLAGVTASGNSGTFDLSGYKSGSLWLNFTAVTGTTPVFTGTLQTSIDGTNFIAVPSSLFGTGGAFAATSGASAQVQMLPFLLPLGLGKCRLSYVISGTTPVFTGTLVGVLNKT
jgi:hypothetical protein